MQLFPINSKRKIDIYGGIAIGSIYGTPSKIIAFIVCLFGTSFPITGVIMWINRTRKKAKKGAGKKVVMVREVVE